MNRLLMMSQEFAELMPLAYRSHAFENSLTGKSQPRVQTRASLSELLTGDEAPQRLLRGALNDYHIELANDGVSVFNPQGDVVYGGVHDGIEGILFPETRLEGFSTLRPSIKRALIAFRDETKVNVYSEDGSRSFVQQTYYGGPFDEVHSGDVWVPLLRMNVQSDGQSIVVATPQLSFGGLLKGIVGRKGTTWGFHTIEREAPLVISPTKKDLMDMTAVDYDGLTFYSMH